MPKKVRRCHSMMTLLSQQHSPILRKQVLSSYENTQSSKHRYRLSHPLHSTFSTQSFFRPHLGKLPEPHTLSHITPTIPSKNKADKARLGPVPQTTNHAQHLNEGCMIIYAFLSKHGELNATPPKAYSLATPSCTSGECPCPGEKP